MILSLKWKKSKTSKPKINGQNKGRTRKFLAKISGAFMLPISVMAIAGIFLGIGAIIQSQAIPQNISDKEIEILITTSALYKFGFFIKMLGEPIFGAMPILFGAAIAISFTEEAGVAVFATIIGYLIFLSLQSVFINPIIDDSGEIIGYNILFGGFGRDPKLLKKLVEHSLGILSLQTSIFGGILVGGIVSWLYNRFHTIKLPQVISFFGGKRFVSLISIVTMIPLSLIFLILWPYFGALLSLFGESLGKAPLGIESLVFGFIERSLIPFGLHHVFYAPLWYSSAGGDGIASLESWIEKYGIINDGTNNVYALLQYLKEKPNLSSGDSFLWQRINGFTSNTIFWKGSDDKPITLPIFDFFSQELNIKLGRFMQGKYPFMIFALPAAGIAMILAAPKENRKIAISTVFPAIFTAALTGITEPIEFTFLFLAPSLYWGFHAVMAAISFWLMNISGAHIGMTVSGGILDLLIYGVIPLMKGTHFWWAIIIGLPMMPIYFFVFLYVIKRFNLQTPGRGSNVKLFTRQDYVKNKKSHENVFKTSQIDLQTSSIVTAFGGWDNIKSFNNCASRLRYDVINPKKVNIEMLKRAGAFGVQKVGEHHFQAIFGPAAEQINSKIVSLKGTPLIENDENPKLKKESKQTKMNHKKQKTSKIQVKSVVDGKISSLESLKDGVFSEKMMGDGVVITPEITNNTVFYAPISGKLVTVFPTGHAYGIENEDGLSIFVHIGIDTVNLKGKGFKSLVKQGDKVKVGDPLVSVDLSYVSSHAPSISTVVLVVPDDSKEDNKKFSLSKVIKSGTVTKNSVIFEVNV